jgi:hypothetical protein
MVDPRIVLIVLLFSVGYYVGEKAVEGIKVVDEKVVSVVKATGHKLLHVVTFGKKGNAEPADQP